MQDASMAFANRFMNAAAGSMEKISKMLEEQTRKVKVGKTHKYCNNIFNNLMF